MVIIQHGKEKDEASGKLLRRWQMNSLRVHMSYFFVSYLSNTEEITDEDEADIKIRIRTRIKCMSYFEELPNTEILIQRG